MDYFSFFNCKLVHFALDSNTSDGCKEMTSKKQADISQDLIQLARIALSGRQQDVHLLIHRFTKKYGESYPGIAESLIALLQESPTRSSPLRRQADTPLPVDMDSRLQLLRVENTALDHLPVLSEHIGSAVNQLISERRNIQALMKASLHPTKSMLFTGPPGVGKTIVAKWIAGQLERPLLVLDLAAVMSSFLGRTGNNIRHVLDYAKNTDCVLLLDELDAIAKRRDDNGEIGELKRLVTVLLQEVDDWPSSGLLLAATNHPDLLDPAVWRRFERVLEFPMPAPVQIEQLINVLLKPHIDDYKTWSKILSYAFKGRSFSDIEREINLVRRSAVIAQKPLSEYMEAFIESDADLSHDEKVELAHALYSSQIISQRRAQEITGISRDTIRKRAQEKPSKRKKEVESA